MAGAIKAAIGDLILTFMWVFCSSLLELAMNTITAAIGVQHLNYHGFPYPSIFIDTCLVFMLVHVFTIMSNALGGANFSPTDTASFYAAGVGSDTLFSMAFRFPAQVLGAVGGVVASMEVMPPKYKHLIKGPSLKVDLHTGAIVEGFLTFLFTFAFLFVTLKGPRSELLRTWLLAMSIVVLVMVGFDYTGASMNPANVSNFFFPSASSFIMS